MGRIPKHLKSYLLIAALFMGGCGIVDGGPTESEGDESIGMDASIATFDATASDEAFKSIPVKNTTDDRITLYKIVFANNPCNAFSYYGVSDANGNIVLSPADKINFTLKSNDRVQVIIRFKAESCSVSNYDTTAYFYFKDAQNKTFSSTAVLHSSGESPAGSANDSGSCEQLIDEGSLLEDRRFGIPSEGIHYLRVDGMRAFIYPPESENYMTVIGTDIGEVDPTAFIEPYLTIEVKERTNTSAKFTLKEITACDEFSIPSALSDAFFLGSPTLLTTSKSYEGTVTLKDQGSGFKEINVEIADFRVRLRADNVGDATPQIDKSIIVDPATKTFQIGMTADLTTKRTAPDTVLVEKFPEAKNAQDAEGNPSLALTPEVSGARAQQGEPLIDSRLMLVGKGKFDNKEDDFIGDIGTAKQFLIDKDAYLYVQIRATLMCSATEEGCQ